MKKKCLFCKKFYNKQYKEAFRIWYGRKYCSNECSQKARVGYHIGKYKTDKRCLICESVFYKSPKETKIGWLNRKYCSHGCYHKSKVGWHQSSLSKLKMSKARKGVMPKNFFEIQKKGQLASIGHKPWNKGLKGFRAGEKSHWWRGGVTPKNQLIRTSSEYAIWRTAVFMRDNYTCQFCGQRGGTLNADHIKPFSTHPELRMDINNGRTLCLECHKTTENYAGRGLSRINNYHD